VTRPQLASGTIRALAVTSPQAWPGLSEIPPVARTVSGYDVRSWMGVATAKGVPAPVVERLNRDIRFALAAPTVKDKFEQIGNEVRASSPDEMRAWVAGEVAKWKKVVAAANIPQQ
jgi:tripartite-type tricarboxylate transporter receptor subunit TctC